MHMDISHCLESLMRLSLLRSELFVYLGSAVIQMEKTTYPVLDNQVKAQFFAEPLTEYWRQLIDETRSP